jgi:hypothetical protein
MISTVLTDRTVPLNCIAIGTVPAVTSATVTFGGGAGALDRVPSSQPGNESSSAQPPRRTHLPAWFDRVI